MKSFPTDKHQFQKTNERRKGYRAINRSKKQNANISYPQNLTIHPFIHPSVHYNTSGSESKLNIGNIRYIQQRTTILDLFPPPLPVLHHLIHFFHPTPRSSILNLDPRPKTLAPKHSYNNHFSCSRSPHSHSRANSTRGLRSSRFPCIRKACCRCVLGRRPCRRKRVLVLLCRGIFLGVWGQGVSWSWRGERGGGVSEER